MQISFTKEDFAKYSNKDYFKKIVNIETVNGLLEHIKDNFSGLKAIGKEDGSVATFDELLSDVNKVCYYLALNNVEPGKHIGLIADNSYSFAVCSLGIMAYGCVAVLLPKQLDKTVVFGCSKKYSLSGLIYIPSFAEKVELINPSSVLLATTAEILALNPDKDYRNMEVAKDDSACIIMTGGTTGKSKGAVLSHDALMCGMINGAYGLDDVMHEVYYCLMPLTHVFGFIRNLLTSLYTGSTIYFNRDKRLMFNEFKEYKPTGLVIVPALAELFLNLIKSYGFDMLGGKLRFIICGAASVPPYLIAEYHKLNVNFCPGYGLTEFSNMVSGNPEGLTKPDSVGLLYPEQEAKVVNGELWLKGRNMLKEYYNEPEENQNAFEDGWFKTGDLVRFDEDNFLYIVGRIKDVIVLSNGENVSPAYIETKVNQLNFIQDSLVTETTNEFGAQILQVEVVLRPSVVKGLGLEGEELSKYVTEKVFKVNNSLYEYERFSKVVIRTEDFPRTPAMKIIRPKKVF